MNLGEMSVDQLQALKDELHAEEDRIRGRLQEATAALNFRVREALLEKSLKEAGVVLPEGTVLLSPPHALMGIVPGEVS